MGRFCSGRRSWRDPGASRLLALARFGAATRLGREEPVGLRSVSTEEIAFRGVLFEPLAAPAVAHFIGIGALGGIPVRGAAARVPFVADLLPHTAVVVSAAIAYLLAFAVATLSAAELVWKIFCDRQPTHA